MIRLGLLTGAAALALAGAASAQNLYGFDYKATPTTPWAGPYVGVHGGYAIDEDNTTYVAGGSAINQTNLAGALRPTTLIRDKDGYVAGGQIGWNVQHGPVVGGVEADFSATDMSTRAGRTGLSGAASNIVARNNYLATVRGRLGYVMPGGVLLYGTGGYAATEIKDRARFRNPQGATAFYGSHEYEPGGWVAGAGAEYAIPVDVLARFGSVFANSKVTTRLEWLHYDFDDKNLNVGSVAGVSGSTGGYIARFSNNVDVVRAGFNYKF